MRSSLIWAWHERSALTPLRSRGSVTWNEVCRDSLPEEPGFKPRVPVATAAADECGWRRRGVGSKNTGYSGAAPWPNRGLAIRFVPYIGFKELGEPRGAAARQILDRCSQ